MTVKPCRHFPLVLCFFFLNINLFIYLFIIYFWLHWVFVAVRGLSLVAVSGGYSSLQCMGFSLRCFPCCGAWGLGTWASVVVARRLSSCGQQAVARRLSGCGAWAQLLQGMWGLPWARARTHIPCIGRRILNHCATREVPGTLLLFFQLRRVPLQ